MRYFAGINVNPYKDDWKEINIEPCFIAPLTEVTAFYDSTEGVVNVSWKKNSNIITLKIEKPEGIYGQIILPQGFVFEKTGLSRQKLESGVHEILCVNEVPDNIIEV